MEHIQVVSNIFTSTRTEAEIGLWIGIGLVLKFGELNDDDDGLWTFRSQDVSFPKRSGRFASWTFRSLDVSLLGRFVPWTIRSLDVSLLGRFVPWTIRSLDVSLLGRFVPWAGDLFIGGAAG